MFKWAVVTPIVVLLLAAQTFGASVTCSPNPAGWGAPVNCTVNYPSGSPSYPPVSVMFSVNGQRFGGGPAKPSGGSYTSSVPANQIANPGTYTVYGQYVFSGTTVNLASTLLTVRGEQGHINPKYVVLGVTYAPPGPSSTVTYANSTFVGNTTNTSQSFESTTSFSISVSSGSIFGWKVIGGKSVKQVTYSTEYSQRSNSSSTVTISKAATNSIVTTGTGDSVHPVNHDYDIIWLWLNPLMLYTVDAAVPNKLQWNGYGFDPNDMNGMHIVGIHVGWLNGHWGPNPSVQATLARSWAAGQKWPMGEGPGINSNDIANILKADPFVNGYTLPKPLPAISADGRFTQIPFPPNPVNYIQAGPGNGGGITTKYDTVYTNTSSVSQGASNTYKQAFGIETGFEGSIFSLHFGGTTKETQTLTWTHGWQNTLTTTKTLTQALSVTGPGCPQSSPPCVPSYDGPGAFIVYQDNLYGTFMFHEVE